jgi:hypothetical protein
LPGSGFGSGFQVLVQFGVPGFSHRNPNHADQKPNSNWNLTSNGKPNLNLNLNSNLEPGTEPGTRKPGNPEPRKTPVVT